MQIINKTPHDVVLHINGEKIVFEKSEAPARVSQECTLLENHSLEIPVYMSSFGLTENLPSEDNSEGYYIVSSIVAAANPDRTDLLIPCDFIRDERGHIIGCKGFISP